MKTFWQILYNGITLPLLWIGIHVLALVNGKVRRGLRGRKDMLVRLEERLKDLPDERRLWIHASSMGEFEQAKPIIESIRQEIADLVILATFFSPSGYENNLRYPYTDYISYLPFDSLRTVRRFIDIARPGVIAFIRYDLWPNVLWECHRRSIPILLTNATMAQSSARRWPVARSFHRAMYNVIESILTVSDEDTANFSTFQLTKPEIVAIGDTRYDRVVGKAERARRTRIIPERITTGKMVLVAGSSWDEDEEVLLPAILTLWKNSPDILVIIAPHEPTIEHLEQLEFKLRGKVRSIRFSYLRDYRDETVIIIDSIGILLSLYACADVAFVGGGFRSNVHNVLEPAAYGIPVLFGPKIENSQEASRLVDAGGGFIVHQKKELYRRLRFLLSNEAARRDAGESAARFVHSRTGATRRILDQILPYFSEDSLDTD